MEYYICQVYLLSLQTERTVTIRKLENI